MISRSTITAATDAIVLFDGKDLSKWGQAGKGAEPDHLHAIVMGMARRPYRRAETAYHADSDAIGAEDGARAREAGEVHHRIGFLQHRGAHGHLP